MMNEPDPNPFRSPPEPPAQPAGDAADMSIAHEPHLAYTHFESDQSELTAGTGLDPLGAPPTMDDEMEHGVWDEPALRLRDAGNAPQAAMTYDKWLAGGELETSRAKSALVTLGLAMLSGPWAVAAALASQLGSGNMGVASIVAVCLIGPLLEEVLKASGLMWVIEKRPYLLRDWRQILACAMMSGLWFAVIENYLYLKVYVPNPTMELTLWRWTVCVLLHVGCTTISGIGLARVWRVTMSQRTRPNVALASPFLITAVVCHAAYNTAMVVFELSGRTT